VGSLSGTDSVTAVVSGERAQAGTHTATVTALAGDSAHNYKLPAEVTKEFTISYLTADTGNIAVNGYRYEQSGVYWFAENDVVTVAAADGYQLSAVLDGTYGSDVSFTKADADNGRLKVYLKDSNGCMTDALDVSPLVKFDTEAPAAMIKVQQNEWKTALNNITFGLFFNNIQDVTITAADNENGSGIAPIYYLVSAEKVTDFSDVQWEEYNGTFSINPDRKYVIYAKATDNVGNETIVNSDGMVLDATKPEFDTESSSVFYGDKEIRAEDGLAGIRKLEVDGEEVVLTDGRFTIVADNQQHTVKATDKAGNTAERTITVYKNYTVIYKADGEEIATKTVGYGKEPDITVEIPEKAGYNETRPYWAIDGTKITAETIITEDNVVITAVYTKNQPGEYKDTTPDTNVGGARLGNSLEELKAAVPFTQEELVRIEQGEDVNIWLVVEDITETVDTADKQLIQAKLEGKALGMYIGVDMFKQTGTENAVKLSQLNGNVKISFVLDSSLVNTNSNVTRDYAVIRIHGGAAENIDCEFDAATNILSFETDRFSTYAVVYKDTVHSTDNGGSSDSSASTPAVQPPRTGDSTNAVMWYGLMVASGAMLMLLCKKRREEL